MGKYLVGRQRTGEVAEVAEDAEVRVGGDEPALEQLLRQRRRERVRHHARVHLPKDSVRLGPAAERCGGALGASAGLDSPP